MLLSLSSLFASALVAGFISPAPQIQHVIIIMQENRSFDSYFGTYPGANGIPMQNGKPLICNPDPITGKCVRSFHDHALITDGGPHDTPDFKVDLDAGKMDGFVRSAINGGSRPPDVMAYHDSREIPNYWSYAGQYVLQDAMFSPSTSWSVPEHLYLVSQWSAYCSTIGDPTSCHSVFSCCIPQPGGYAWTDITWLLHRYNVSWKYFIFSGMSADVVNPGEDGGSRGIHQRQNSSSASYWNPLPLFADVIADKQVGNIVDGTRFYADAAAGTLPAVSWVVPDDADSEHPPASPVTGMQYVSGLVNAVMSGPDWNSTAIFVTWDEWGGLFDHAIPPLVDWGGYGFRVPALVISPWAKRGYIDHQVLSFDAYDKFIEDIFLGGQRLDPRSDGRADPRPDVREDYSGLGDLLNDFDFSHGPAPPMLLRNARVIRP